MNEDEEQVEKGYRVGVRVPVYSEEDERNDTDLAIAFGERMASLVEGGYSLKELAELEEELRRLEPRFVNKSIVGDLEEALAVMKM